MKYLVIILFLIWIGVALFIHNNPDTPRKYERRDHVMINNSMFGEVLQRPKWNESKKTWEYYVRYRQGNEYHYNIFVQEQLELVKQ